MAEVREACSRYIVESYDFLGPVIDDDLEAFKRLRAAGDAMRKASLKYERQEQPDLED